MEHYKRLSALAAEPHPGKGLLENLAGLGEIELPPREDKRPIPLPALRKAVDRVG